MVNDLNINIHINEVANLGGTDGKKIYFKITGESNGKKIFFSTFNADLAKTARDNIGKEVNAIYYINDKGFMTLKSLLPLNNTATGSAVPYVNNSSYTNSKADPVAMYVSYCKDIFIALSSRAPVEISNDVIADESVRIVSKFKEAFNNAQKQD